MRKKTCLPIALMMLLIAQASCDDNDSNSDNSSISKCISTCQDSVTLILCQDGQEKKQECQFGCSDSRCLEITEVDCLRGKYICIDDVEWICADTHWRTNRNCLRGCDGDLCIDDDNGSDVPKSCDGSGEQCINGYSITCENNVVVRADECAFGCHSDGDHCNECYDGEEVCENGQLFGCEGGNITQLGSCGSECTGDECTSCNCDTHENCTAEELESCSACPSGKVLQGGICIDEGLLKAKVGQTCEWDDWAYCSDDGKRYYCDQDSLTLQVEACEGGCHVVDLSDSYGYYDVFCGGISERCTQNNQDFLACIEENDGDNSYARMAVMQCLPVVGGGFSEYIVDDYLEESDVAVLYAKHGMDYNNVLCSEAMCNSDNTSCYDGCKSNNDCTEKDAPLCDKNSKLCVQCLSDSDCNGLKCDGGMCFETCQKNEDCSDGKQCIMEYCLTCHDGDLNTGKSDLKLQCVLGSMSIESESSSDLNLKYPNLRYVKGDLVLKSFHLLSISLPNLKSVSNLSVQFEKITELVLPRLEKVTSNGLYSIYITYNEYLQKIELPLLETVSKVRIENNDELMTVLIPSLKKASEGIIISAYPEEMDNRTYKLDLSSLESSNDMELSFPGKHEFPNLKTIEFHLDVLSSNAEELKFPALTKCGSVSIDSNDDLKIISFPKLEEVTFDFAITENKKLETLDLSSFDFFQNVNSHGWFIDNNPLLPCASLCTLKNAYFDTHFSGSELFNYSEMFPGNKADNTCPNASYMVWEQCP